MAHATDAGARNSRPPDAPKRSRRAEPAETAVPTEPWHALATERVLAKLHTTPHGLSTGDADQRFREFGPNILPPARGGMAFRILLRQFRDPLIYVLLGSTVLAMLTGKLADGLVISAVVILNAIIGFIQEYRASKAIKALSELVPFEATVMRDGQKHRLASVALVPGDVILLEAGDKVPADMRLIAVRGLAIEEAALTGESVPAEKRILPVPENAAIGERPGIAYSGTLVTTGTGTGIVVATGARTELGRISRMLDQAKALETPLTRQLGAIGKLIAAAIIVISLLLFGVGVARGYPVADAILAAVAMAVAAIPEGLPAIVTIALAIGVRRMAQRRAIIRKLPAVETLGATTVICSDKTGTLTRNEMTVQELWTPDGAFRLSGIGYTPKGDLRDADGAPVASMPEPVEALIIAGALCNDAVLRRTDDGWRVAGDPTEGALVVAAEKLGCRVRDIRERWRRLDAVPFQSERQYMATLHEDPQGTQTIFIKGAPEVILQRCSTPLPESEGIPFDARVMQAVEQIAADGMRVLACAARTPDARLEGLAEEDTAGQFVFLGLQGMIDPPRTEAIQAVRACREAGITVKMITGDHKATARAVGEALTLVANDAPAVGGSELADLSPEELRRVALDHNVFARVAPEHKLRLVQALQDAGHVVAMTGDGVNDAPALKQADIGVAMGITGTSVSKEAADMVLTDDNFATIEAAVEEGRRVYDNLVKAFAFVLPTNLGLALILIVAVAFFPITDGAPLLPITAVQILWINLVAAVALALPLAFEAMEPNLMGRPPRRPDVPILSPFVITRTVVVAVLMAAGAIGLFLVQIATQSGAAANAQAQTEAVTTVIMFQIFYLLNCRSLKDSILTVGLLSNPWIYVGIGVVLVLHGGFVYLPLMNAVFGSTPLGLQSWVEATTIAFLIMPVIALEKWWRRRRRALRP